MALKSKWRKYIISPSHIHSSRILGFNEAKLNKGILYLPEIYEIDINSVSNGCSKIDFLILLNDTISFYLNNRAVTLALYDLKVGLVGVTGLVGSLVSSEVLFFISASYTNHDIAFAYFLKLDTDT